MIQGWVAYLWNFRYQIDKLTELNNIIIGRVLSIPELRTQG